MYTSLRDKSANDFFLQLLRGLFKHNVKVIGIIDHLHPELGHFHQTATVVL